MQSNKAVIAISIQSLATQLYCLRVDLQFYTQVYYVTHWQLKPDILITS